VWWGAGNDNYDGISTTQRKTANLEELVLLHGYEMNELVTVMDGAEGHPVQI